MSLSFEIIIQMQEVYIIYFVWLKKNMDDPILINTSVDYAIICIIFLVITSHLLQL